MSFVVVVQCRQCIAGQGSAQCGHITPSEHDVLCWVTSQPFRYGMQVRQLSGVLLRKHLRSHWRRLPAASHKQIQTALQQRLVQESVEPVRRAVAELIASIARFVC